jgi:myo-inositol-1-phosphate synthase
LDPEEAFQKRFTKERSSRDKKRAQERSRMAKGKEKRKIAPPKGRLGVLIPGIGAVATTLIGGTLSVRRRLAKPIGSLTQMGTIRLGKRTERRIPLIKEFVPLAGLEDLAFGGWDIHGQDAYRVALDAGVLRRDHLEPIKQEMRSVKPMKAVFDRAFVRRLQGNHVKRAKTKMHLVDLLQKDIETFKEKTQASRLVMIWCGSTEVYLEADDIHKDLGKFEKALKENHPAISPSMIYAYAAIRSGIPFANGAPNLTENIPALLALAKQKQAPVAGDDFKTGQTMMKTVIAPALKARMLGLGGWFSTNILGNRDGEVLDDPDSFKTKEVSKLSVLEYILQPQLYPELYRDAYHKVRINYYPPRGDNKEGWDNIDIFGWMGYPMQIKIDFLCRDSILAAPVALDLILFMDLAKRAGKYGIQEWLSFYFKNPIVQEGLYPEHDLFIQLAKLKNNLRYLMGEELITHLGVEYYPNAD